MVTGETVGITVWGPLLLTESAFLLGSGEKEVSSREANRSRLRSWFTMLLGPVPPRESSLSWGCLKPGGRCRREVVDLRSEEGYGLKADEAAGLATLYKLYPQYCKLRPPELPAALCVKWNAFCYFGMLMALPEYASINLSSLQVNFPDPSALCDPLI